MMEDIIRLRNRGLSVFPVSIETKVPTVAWKLYQENLPAYEDIEGWFAKGDCAVGVATGGVSDLFLLDFDFAKHPEAKEFYDAHEFPRTWKERTASGGIHIYFRWESALDSKQTNTTSRLWRGVDTKGFGGYSKICPSPGYEWIVPPHMSSLAAVPEWLVELLPNKEVREISDLQNAKPQDWMLAELENVDPADPINGRTPTFVRAIGRLKAKGMSEVEVKGLLTPWAVKYDYPKLDGLVDDQFRRYPPRPQEPVMDVSNHSLRAFVAAKKPIPYIVPGLVGFKTINVWAGLQESRKSWLLLDLAVAVATGTSWLGMYPCTRGKVIVIDQERAGDEMKRRLEALIAGRGLNIDDLEGQLVPKADLDPPFKLNIDASFATFEKMVDEVRPSLVLIDSLSAIQTGDIMRKSDMQQLFERLKVLRMKYSVAFVILHHENKGTYGMMREKLPVTAENIEGSGVINQVPEGLMVARNLDGESTMLHHVKNSYGMKKAPVSVRVMDMVPDKSKIRLQAH